MGEELQRACAAKENQNIAKRRADLESAQQNAPYLTLGAIFWDKKFRTGHPTRCHIHIRQPRNPWRALPVGTTDSVWWIACAKTYRPPPLLHPPQPPVSSLPRSHMLRACLSARGGATDFRQGWQS